jgi:multidrug resistance efflux pump
MLPRSCLAGVCGIIFGGMELPEYHDGDRVSPGRLMAQILDTERRKIQSKVTETDRGSLASGQRIEARVDSLPLERFAAG